jgi:NADH-quinone oxidoreductase subunit L
MTTLIAAAVHVPPAAPIVLIPVLPLAGAVALLLTGRRWRGTAAGWLASLAVGGAFLSAVALFAVVVSNPAGSRTFVDHWFEWIRVGSFAATVDLRLDPLSMIMALTVTGVATLIHVYAIDYMRGDPRYARFFGYMNLFVFFMLMLVLANNYLLLYLGWEGVGLCSYLLIGFWFERPAAAFAAKKAFIVTRIGDSAFLIGIAFMWSKLHSLDFGRVFAGAHGLPNGTATILALLLFAGAMGKSAQLPLHVWLPDAMEGPTPVSALIHAATMVTAGVYLVVRSHPIFEASSSALTVVAIVGIVTAIYAGLSAIGQDDIKRMLAYSTISQLGYMFFGAGLGVYASAIFLLVAHAFFKALLFLGAGSVMHGLHENTDMMKMGALRRRMRVTAWTWFVGWLAMAGIFPFSGFFAKDQVIAAASQAGRSGLWVVALVGALLTSIYVSRATFLAFLGRSRTAVEPHESPPLMRFGLVALAIGATLAGLLGLSANSGVIARFLAPVVGSPRGAQHGPSEILLTVISLAIALLGIGIAYLVYVSGRIDWQALRARLAPQKRMLMRGFYLNDLYNNAFVATGEAASAFVAYVFDARVVDGAVNGVGSVWRWIAARGRRVQTGLVRNYALAFLAGVVGIFWFLAVRY